MSRPFQRNGGFIEFILSINDVTEIMKRSKHIYYCTKSDITKQFLILPKIHTFILQ